MNSNDIIIEVLRQTAFGFDGPIQFSKGEVTVTGMEGQKIGNIEKIEKKEKREKKEKKERTPAQPALIYVAEDDLALARGMKFTLERENYEVETFTGCVPLRKAVKRRRPRLLLLDWNLPDGDGLALCRSIKEQWDIPVLMITARDMEIDQVMCLEGGADDYMAKPFSLSVLKARITALLRRSVKFPEEEILASGPLRLDGKRMRVYRAGQELDLSPTQIRLLQYFLENKNQVLLKEQILERVWDREGMFVEENTLSVNIGRLRKKIGEDDPDQGRIKTIHGMGYLWEER